MAQRRRFGRQHQAHEQFTLTLQAGIEGLLDRRSDRLDAGQRRGVSTRRSLDAIACELEIRLGVRHVDTQVAHSLQGAPLGNDHAREIHRRRQQIPI
jgi:hypothetical protein